MSSADYRDTFDVIVIGGGPAGHHAAMEATHAGRSALLIERELHVGGSCVARGTIPSKTLRETALALNGFRRKSGDVAPIALSEDLQVASLMTRLDQVVTAHQRYMARQLERSHVVRWHGRARFTDAHTIQVSAIDGSIRCARGQFIVIATGSRPRTPAEIPIDHTHLLDSDSILSMTYLPRTLTVLGAGVIAAEYASIFAALGTSVTMVDKAERPLSFLDPELTGRFVEAFEATGSRYIGRASAKKAEWDGIGEVVTTLSNGEVLHAEKLLCALGRLANLDGLEIAAAGLTATDRGLIAVDGHLRTSVPHIYGAGDVIGPPSLASSSMDQGRRAVIHALGLPTGVAPELIPMGIYSIPEMSQVGLTQAQAVERHGGCIVGRAPFAEIARGQIAAIQDGLLKLIADKQGRKVLGVAVVGEGAAELVGIGQMALLNGNDVDVFIANTLNFPTLAECYRVAALDIAHQRAGSGQRSAIAS